MQSVNYRDHEGIPKDTKEKLGIVFLANSSLFLPLPPVLLDPRAAGEADRRPFRETYHARVLVVGARTSLSRVFCACLVSLTTLSLSLSLSFRFVSFLATSSSEFIFTGPP